MQEKDLKNMLGRMDIPSPGVEAKNRTADAAWARLRQTQEKAMKISFPRGFGGGWRYAGAFSLIIVLGFGSLSYMVTQSSRSGGGDANNETNLISSAQITQYPSSVRTSVIRLLVSNKATIDTLNFDAPENITAGMDVKRAVFHSEGGGATYILSSADVMENNAPGVWHYNSEFEVAGIGTSKSASVEGNEVIAFLPGVSEAICRKINVELGISGDVRVPGFYEPFYKKDMTLSYKLPAGEGVLGFEVAPALKGHAFGCFRSESGESVYYHVIIER